MGSFPRKLSIRPANSESVLPWNICTEEIAHRSFRVRYNSLAQLLKMPQRPLNRGLSEQLRIILGATFQAACALDHRQGQVELRRARIDFQWGDGHGGKAQIQRQLILQREHDLDQWQATGT